jgi:DNA-binding HxlR family transcriptional regulator
VIEGGDGGYRLTAEGERLLEAYPPINDWAERWASRLREP